MPEKPKYLVVDTKVLPEVYWKVVYAKRLMATGQAKTQSEAAKAAGLSRSAFYKYKEYVFQFNDRFSYRVATFYATLMDKPGALSALLGALYQQGFNVLTINQNIPVDGVAPVSISVSCQNTRVDEADVVGLLRQVDGVVDVRLVTQ